MEIKEDDEQIISKKPLDPKKEKIQKAINDITEIIDKHKKEKNENENEIINELVSYINDNNLDCCEILDRSKATLLHLYCTQQQYFHLKIYSLTVEKLLNDTNKLNEYLLKEDTTKVNIFESASELGDKEIFNILSKYLENNESLLSLLINQEKNNIFHISAREEKISSLLFYYDFYHNDISVLNTRNRSQWTPLIMACYRGYYEYVQVLINLGADYSLVEKDGKNALFYAVESKNYRIIKYLILIGMDKNKKDNKNKKAIDYCNDADIQDLLKNKNFIETNFKCQIEYQSLKGHKKHIYYLVLLFIIIVIQILIICLFKSQNKEENCEQDFERKDFIIEFVIFIICIFCEAFGIFYYYFFHFKFTKNTLNYPNENISLYELYLANNDICAKCKKVKKHNTQHCIACDKCIDNWDHHCFWLNTCINNKNKRYFNFFMIQLFLIIAFNLILSLFLFMNVIIFPKIYYAFTYSCAEDENDFNFISVFLLILFIIYFIICVYLLFGTLLPFLIEFLCSKTTDDQKEINLNFSTNENKVLLSGVEEENKI